MWGEEPGHNSRKTIFSLLLVAKVNNRGARGEELVIKKKKKASHMD